MRRNGYIIPILFVLALGALFYFVNEKHSKEPNRYSREITSNFNPYPNSTSWQVTNSRKICIFYLNKCDEVPSVITFKSQDEWITIYQFYKKNLVEEGWQTKSDIVTSIPSSIVFGSITYFENVVCEAIIKQKGRNASNLLIDPEETDEYIISVTCDTN